jgi:phage/plasmid-like protein (TIGR03299 family)
MAHQIEAHDTMFSVRQKPWHGLGVILDDYPETIEDALDKSGLTWEVEQTPLFMAGPAYGEGHFVPALESTMLEVKDYRANVRTDTSGVLGIVGKDYKVVQNREAFAWLDTLLGHDVEIETAGSLQNGKRVWVLAKLPELVEVGGDEIQRYVFCANSHDGSMAVTAAATNVRIVCANTLGWALNSATRSYKFRHTGDLSAKLEEARKVMDLTLKWDAAFKELGDELAQIPMSVDTYDNKVVKPLLSLDNPSLELGDQARVNREEARETLISLFEGTSPNGDTTGNSPGTKWVAANAVAEYADWFRRYTVRTDQMARSFEDQDMKQRGLTLVQNA